MKTKKGVKRVFLTVVVLTVGIIIIGLGIRPELRLR
jgi:hypothetical protein